MTGSLLQSFLDNRFIKTDETEHIENLNKVSSEIQKLLKKKKTKVITYSLVALDPTISDNDPTIEEVEAIIIKQWPAFRNSVAKTKDKPLAYIQAVILEALNLLSKDVNFAAIIWYTGCDILGRYKMAELEEVLSIFLLEIGNNVELAGREKWRLSENLKIDSLDSINITLPKISSENADESQLVKELLAAAVYSSWQEQAGGGENPHNQGQNNYHWPKFFAERAGKGIAEEINAALSSQSKSLTAIVNAIQEAVASYLTNLQQNFNQMSLSVVQSSKSLAQRSGLLWWKEALYSETLNAGYRTLNKEVVPIAMAVDLANKVPPIYPNSVDYFLKETLRDVLGNETDTRVTLIDILAQLQQFSEAEKQLLNELFQEDEGRKSLGTCMAGVLQKRLSIDDFFKHTGLEKKLNISLGELTIWLFHDLQAYTLAKTK